jgi:hypothetical protein
MVCGPVTAYTASTSSGTGSLTIAGITFPISSGAVLSGAGAVTTGSTLGMVLNFNGQGLISSGTVTATSCPNGTTITSPIAVSNPPPPPGGGPVTIPAGGGTITFGGHTYPIAGGVSLTISSATPLSAMLYLPRGWAFGRGGVIAE